MIRSGSITALFFLILFAFQAQNGKSQEVLDGAYIDEHEKTRQVIRHPHLRQADVMWEKRVWRVIDNKQKINLPLYYPVKEIKDRKSLWQVIVENLSEGSITAYRSGPSNNVDDFSEGTYQWAAFKKEVIVDSCYNSRMDTMIPNPTKSRDIYRYRLKEVWYFDKQRSVMDVKIIGLAPFLYTDKACASSNSREAVGRMFWLYFPECRYVFQNYEAFNQVGGNKAEMRSFDDIFIKRRFNSFLVKESNVYDRSIRDYKSNMDALLESKRIKNEMFRIEHDLWSY
ncbi:MAG: gliding motility protein GldN [Flavobacteriales bacterium]